MAEVERERAERSRHWQRRRERAWFEAERAARQDQACEPENRLVGRERERRWEEAWKAQRPVEDDYERWQRSAPGRLSPDDEAAIRTLAASRLAVGAPGRRRPPRDLGRRLRAAAAACTPPAAANLGEQGSARRIEEAEAMPGAVECRWPGSPRAGPPHRALGGHYGWNIERCFEDQKSEIGLDQYEGRRYRGRKRHLILSCVSSLFLSRVRQEFGGENPGADGMPGAHGGGGLDPVLVAGPEPAAEAVGADVGGDPAGAASQRPGCN